MLPSDIYSPDLDWFFGRADAAIGFRSDAADRLDRMSLWGRRPPRAPSDRRAAKHGERFGEPGFRVGARLDGDNWFAVPSVFDAIPRGSTVTLGNGVIGGTERVDDRLGSTAAGKRHDESPEGGNANLRQEFLAGLPTMSLRVAAKRAADIRRALRRLDLLSAEVLLWFYGAGGLLKYDPDVPDLVDALRSALVGAHRKYRQAKTSSAAEETLIVIALRHTQAAA
jgi:hypothetical protein